MKKLILAAMLVLCMATGAFADSPYLYGIHWYGTAYDGDAENMASGKSLWVLETVMVNDTGSWGFSSQLAKFQTIVSRGHTLVIRLQPQWGYAIPATQGERDQYLVNLKSVVQAASGLCHIWQIGNEMNLYGEYGGGVLGAADYIAYYKQVRTAIQSVYSPLGAQLALVGPVSPGAYAGEVRHTDGNAYLDAMCKAIQLSANCDGFALHGYASPYLNAADSRNDFRNCYSSQLATIDKYGAGFKAKPALILEWNRQTLDMNAQNEEQTAQFLIGAYQDLAAWNANASNHKIKCATWFVYDTMGSSGWNIFSLRVLHGVNPRGATTDVWDAFQYACANDTSTPPPAETPAPVITPVPTAPPVTPVPGADGNIYSWNGSGWSQLSGSGVKISVNTSGNPFVVNSAGMLWQYTNAWNQLRSSDTQDVGAGANGTVAITAKDYSADGGRIYKQSGASWTEIGGAARRVDVDSNGNLWVVNAGGDLWQWNGSWTKMRTLDTQDVGCGPGGQVAVTLKDDGTSGGKIMKLQNGTWTEVGGRAVCIDIANDGSLWVVNKTGLVYQYYGGNWTLRKDGGGMDVGCSPSQGVIWILSR